MAIRKQYIELSKAKITDKKNIIISKNETNGGYTLAQQVKIEEGKHSLFIFMKGATYIEELDGLYNLRDAINEAIKKIEDK